MQCPVCKDVSGAQTGVLELVSALSVTIEGDGSLNRNSAVLLDEYLSCNNCADLNCDAEDCVPWHWEQHGGERRVKLGAVASGAVASSSTPSKVTPAVVVAP